MKKFVDNVVLINGLAEQIKGFIWRRQDASGNALNIRVYDNSMIVPNLTTWASVEALERFVFKTAHKTFFKNRRKWFDPIDVSNVMWWDRFGVQPSMLEGVKRRDYFINNGPTEHAFTDYKDANYWLEKIMRSEQRSAVEEF